MTNEYIEVFVHKDIELGLLIDALRTAHLKVHVTQKFIFIEKERSLVKLPIRNHINEV